MAIQETRQQGEAIIELETRTLLQTGKNAGRREFGAAGIADNICKENIVGFQPICKRICTFRMKTKFRNITFTNIQAQTEDKENFHAQLRTAYGMTPNIDGKIVLGDTNAKIR